MSIQIFLGKGGQTFGPYDVTQYEAMRTQPDFSSYKYVWDGRDPQPAWKPLEAAPPSPMIGPGAPPPDDAQVAVAPAILAPPAPLAARQASPAPERVPAEERPLRVVRQIDGNGLEAAKNLILAERDLRVIGISSHRDPHNPLQEQ